MDEPQGVIMNFFFGFLVGFLAFVVLGGIRALGSAGWDTSNFLNWLRLLGHVIMHPADFALMLYPEESTFEIIQMSTSPLPPQYMLLETSKGRVIFRRPFWYIGEDEFQTVVSARPRPSQNIAV
jgi:hypothetical protein